MSLDAQDWVWEHSKAKNTSRLVMLAIADKAPPGGDCVAYAGTTMLMKRANASKSAVVEAVDRLIDSGELEIVEDRKGPRGETVYRLPGACGYRRSGSEGGPESVPVQNPDPSGFWTPGGPESVPEGSGFDTGRGPESVPQNACNASNASRTQTERRAEEPARRGPGQQSPPPADRSDGLHPIPDDFALNDTMRRWVRSTYPELDPEFETTQFVSYWRAEGRRKRNWREAWQKWIRDSAKRTRDQQQRPHLRAVKPGGYQPFQPPSDPSVYANGF